MQTCGFSRLVSALVQERPPYRVYAGVVGQHREEFERLQSGLSHVRRGCSRGGPSSFTSSMPSWTLIDPEHVEQPVRLLGWN